jgi:protease-4
VISLLNCEGLYEKVGIEEIDITSGANKTMGSAGVEMTQEQHDIFQSLVDEAFNQFVGIICEGRDMDEETVRRLADGRIYSALQAKELDLLDEIGSYEDCVAAFCKEEKIEEYTTFYAPESGTGLMQTIYGMASRLKKKSDAEIATDILNNSGNGVLKYYAR